MVLLFYLLGSFGTYMCSFGKVAQNCLKWEAKDNFYKMERANNCQTLLFSPIPLRFQTTLRKKQLRT